MVSAADGLVLELSRRLSASAERVFTAMTEPADLARWWGPAGFALPEVELDLRPGGGYRFGMRPPEGDLFHLSGEFLEIERPTMLSYTFRWDEPDPDDRETVVRVELEEWEPDLTELSLWHGRFATEERFALHEAGWTDSLLRLSDLLRPGE